MNKLLIVDGTNLLCQMFFGMPSRIVNKEGKAIQGTLGFIGALLKIIRMICPTHIVVLFDGEHEYIRTEINPDYKANRIDNSNVPEEENPFSQLYDVYSALDFLNIMHTEIDVYEADDVIASYALRYGKDMQVIILSFDSDFFQLINENVEVLRYRGDNSIVCDINYIKDRFGILPEQYAYFKSLVGDKSDNIKGAERIGIKTASSLINQFESLTEILKRADEIKKPSIRASVKKNAEKLKQNLSLIELDDKAEIPFYIDELKYFYTGIKTNEVLLGIRLK